MATFIPFRFADNIIRLSFFFSFLLYLYPNYSTLLEFTYITSLMGNRYSNPYDPYWYDYDPMYGGVGGYYDYNLSAVSVSLKLMDAHVGFLITL